MNFVAADTLPCPSCRHAMTALCVPARPLGYLALDFCVPCRGLWFDPHESTRLAPAGILELFKLIHAATNTPTLPLSTSPACPRCQDPLVLTRDLARGGPFAYHRCPRGHGRFTGYAQFLTEKGFVRHVARQEVEKIAVSVGQINCHNCGGPVDLRVDTACPHCGSPIAVLDTEAMAKAFVGYSEAAAPRILRIEGDLTISAPTHPFLPRRQGRSLLEIGIDTVAGLFD